MTYCLFKEIDVSFEDAVERTKAALARQGFGILSDIDVAATMKAKLDVNIGPYRILGACSPQHAYRALRAEPRIGALLPCNVIVRALSEQKTEVAAIDPVIAMQAVENPVLAETAETVRARLKDVIDAL